MRAVAVAIVICCVAGSGGLVSTKAVAASPSALTVSTDSPQAAWTGAFLLASPAAGCFPLGTRSQLCDFVSLTIAPPSRGQYTVRVSVVAASGTDDIDLSIRNASGDSVASAASDSGVEEVVLVNPPAGTYTIAVRPFVVAPSDAYSGRAILELSTRVPSSKAYRATPVPPGFSGVPRNEATGSISDLRVSSSSVGRGAAEPTIGVNANNVAFFTASTFDFPSGDAPARLAHTLVMRSKDRGRTWQAVSPPLVAGLPEDEDNFTFPPLSLDPYVHVDSVGVNPASRTGRVFSVDLDAACGANAVFSDDEGTTWTRVPLFGCASPINDHQTVLTARPPAGFLTVGYPNMVYFCFNRVVDSSCVRSNNGGLTFAPSGSPAFTGEDPAAGGLCGGLTGHLAADGAGRIFLPKGHCTNPWVAISSDAGTTWNRVKIAGHLPMADHEVSLAVDTKDNIYAVWQDGVFRLPFLSFSTDHGLHWSTPVMIAPPGVREVNFPTIVAGDPGRVAVLFPGTENPDTGDATRPWNAYVVVSTSVLTAQPTFVWTTANDPADPVHRGSCGPGRCDAEDDGSMFDFLDIQTSPADGAFWGTVSDTCVADKDPAKNCITNPQAEKLRPGLGVAFRQVKGPSLFVTK